MKNITQPIQPETTNINVNPMPGGCGFSEIIYKETLKFCGNPRSIIELGCGNGGNLAQFTKATHTVGIDPYLPNVKQASKKASLVIEGSHEVLKLFKAKEFDVGITLSVLNHIAEVETIIWILRQLFRICKKLVLIEPYIEGVERQFERGEVKAYKNTWLHDYKKILTDAFAGLDLSITPYPLYATNSGPYYHLITMDCKLWTYQE